MGSHAPTLEQLWKDHGRYVWRALRYLGVRDADLEDVCQEVFVVVHRKLPDFEGRSKLETWLYGICVRTASDYRKRAHVRREQPSEAPEEHLADTAQPGGDAAERLAQRQLLSALLEGLDEDKRTVLVLYELEGLGMKEVAEIVGCPLQTAYTRLRVAREQVEATLKRLRARGDA